MRAFLPLAFLVVLLTATSPLFTWSAENEAELPRGVSDERLMEFCEAHQVSSIRYSGYGVPNYVLGSLAELESAGSAADAALGFFEGNCDIFRMSSPQSQLRLASEEVDNLGVRRLRFQQMHHGLEVVGGHLTVMFNQHGLMETVSGRFYPNLDIPTKPTVDSLTAIVLATFHVSRSEIASSVPRSRLVVLHHQDKFRLVWEVTVGTLPGNSATAIVDARSGELLTGFESLPFPE